MNTQSPAPESPAAARSRGRRWLRAAVFLGVALLLVIASGIAFLHTQAALEMVIARAIAASEGRLSIEGATGSLLRTVRVARIAWRGDDVFVEANDAALTWSALGLFTRHIDVSGLGAHRLAFTIKASEGPLALPADLALPLEADIRNVGVERLEWRVGARTGTITGVAFDYAGGAHTHAISRLRFVADAGTLEGSAEIGAVAPFPIKAALAFTGDGAFRDTRADLVASGPLEHVALAATGTSRDAALVAKVTLAPFAPALVVDAHIDARDVDIARFVATLPATRLTVAIDALPIAEGFAGTLTARNADAGALDAGRVPLTQLTSRFDWNGRVLVLQDIDARLPGDARVTGRATLPVDTGATALQLAVRDLDLHRVHSSLIATRLAGTVAAEVAQSNQSVRAELTQSDMALNFAATVTGRRIDIERFRGRAGGGEVTGRGFVTLDPARAFDVTADAAHFDPSRFGAFPAGSLDGKITARGRLASPWNVEADIALAQGSRLEGVAVNGRLHADASPKTLRNVTVDVAVASATIAVTGAAGTAGDTLAFKVDAAKLEDLRGVLARHAGVAIPETIAGALHVRGTLTSEPGGNGLDVDVHGNALQWGKLLRAGTLEAHAGIAPGGLTLDPAANATRGIALKLAATRVSAPQGELATLAIDGSGTLAHHTARFAFNGEGIDAHARFTGGLKDPGAPSLSWAGSLDALDSRGAYALQLDAPATIEWTRDHLHVGGARLHVADGVANLEEFRWDQGKITTRGAFAGVPLNAVTQLAGVKSPLASTMVIAGDWSLAASPRLNGTLHVRRERGDLFGTESVNPDARDLALGITTLDIDARFVDDSVKATGTLRSLRAGNADATLSVAAASSNAEGRISFSAPMTATLAADLVSLKPLQPWLGTLAVIDGRAHLDVTGSGTLANAVLAGTLSADAVRVDVPQYGVHWQDGRLRAHFADRSLVLEDLSFAGGDGKFSAQGTLARASAGGGAKSGPEARVTWKADKFRVVNRPDLRLAVDGSGTLAVENNKLAVRGSVRIDDGRIDYEPASVGTLGNDVIIEGRPRSADNAAAALDLPLVLDLDVALGDSLRFSGEGLDTRLAGNLRVTTNASGGLVTRGTIRAVNGTYFVFGQRLEIDRGQLIFDGPADNPAIDVVALRKNVAVEAGVEVTGTVRVPRVRLVSNPPVPDGEKLSWLMTGQGLDRASRADLAALGSASASLLGKGQKPLTTSLANSIGLDDISLRERTNAVTSGTTSQVVAFGKRINDRLTLVYEQGLTVANNALRIEYALTRTLTLRAEAGIISSLGLYFRRTYD